MHRNLLIFCVGTILLASLAAGKLAIPDLPMPQEYVDDLAGVIDAEHKHALNGILQELEQKTGVQYIILTVESTSGVPIEEYSMHQAHDVWKLGQKDKDNGLLLTVAVKDHKYRFEVGYGLEGFITDGFTGQVGRDFLVPYFRKDQYGQGIYEATLRVVQRIAQEYHVTLTGMPNLPSLPAQPTARNNPIMGQRGTSVCACPCCALLIVLFLIMLFLGGGRGRRGSWWWLLLLPFLFRGGGGHRRGGYGGGPFGGGFGGFGGGFGGRGGGGFGHFGGGGGGGFGGGGATGRW